MPLFDYRCPSCGDVREELLFNEDAAPCQKCGGVREKIWSATYGKTGIFPYTTCHLTGDGSPITVESLGHLRSLERRYGVSVHGFSQNPGNPDTPRDLPRHRPGGREFER